MTCCCSAFGDIAEQQFDEKKVGQELSRYREKGPGPTTRLLRDGIVKSGTLNGRLLDIGSGLGSLTFELLERGVAGAIAVDASSAYIAAAAREAERRSRAEVIQLVHGDFMTVASQLPTASLVTLDRVVCCYPGFALLLQEAVRHAERCLAMSYPRDVWYVRAYVAIENAGRRFKSNEFRTFVHSAAAMERIMQRAGFDLSSRDETWTWSADVYVRRRPLRM